MMDILFLVHLLNAGLMIAMPVGLAIFLTRRWRTGWRLWLIGAATFILSQVGHIPFNALLSPLLLQTGLTQLSMPAQILISAVILGLSAGLFEELFRYGMFRWWAKDARSWRAGILTGAGHGGAEAILLGLLALYVFLQLAALRHADLSAFFPADQLELAREQVAAFWSMTWYDSLLGALERLFTIPIQISMAVLVLQCFLRRQGFWVWLAVAYHALVDATAVLGVNYLGSYGTEALVAGYAILSVTIIFLLRTPEPAPPPEGNPPPAPPVFIPRPPEETAEKLEDTRFV
jgi:uncharacterized membrane protein YhfC